ncbi:MAG: hypothetical protein GX336_04225 [Halanaerobiaceae bacterium]|nr:hypothetical protein [Halanaerobiaceae bacterium]
MESWKRTILYMLLFLSCSLTIFAAPSIDRVSYLIRGDFNKVDSLQIKLEDRLDTINTLGLVVLYDGNSFKLEGDWQIEFLKRPTYRMNLAFVFPLNLADLHLGKGLGFTGESFYSTPNRFIWNLNYFFDADKWTYGLGLQHPLYEDTSLIIGVGNNYWDRENKLFFGFKVGL